MTASQFLKKKKYPSFNNEGGLGIHYVEEVMKEFAKYHVQKAFEMIKNESYIEYLDNYGEPVHSEDISGLIPNIN